MSSKRKDSHPSRATSNTGSTPLGINSTVITKVIKDKSESSENEFNKKDEYESPASSTGWTGFNGSGSVAMTGHLAGLLAQNGQNGGSSSSPGLSDQTADNSCHDDASSTGAKDDDDDDDDEDDKLEGLTCGDPEKLKAFNMFVRLFVDENLDRHVPISKQPKEKIQAIIDSCTRQFPEFAPRARKRIRTYLKSCRRTKRSREQAGLDGINARPAPPHLTSIQAEQLLAKACENESENAKRMRMGLEPVSQPMPAPSMHSIVDVLSSGGCGPGGPNPTGIPTMGGHPPGPPPASVLFPNMSAVTSEQPSPSKIPKTEYKPEQLATLLQAAASQGSTTLTPVLTSTNSPQQQGLTVTPTSGNFNNYQLPINGTTLFKQSFGQATNGNATFPPTATLLHNQSNVIQNGPSADVLRKQPLLNHKLNPTEIAAVRQLVTGYRESAAFLLRSADELEHLLQIQPKL